MQLRALLVILGNSIEVKQVRRLHGLRLRKQDYSALDVFTVNIHLVIIGSKQTDLSVMVVNAASDVVILVKLHDLPVAYAFC